MLSIPPATMICPLPTASASCASIAASIAEPHILLTVVQPVAVGSPALSAACRAGAWPWPAGRTQPMTTLSTAFGSTRARSSAALIATAPRSLAASEAKSPWSPPIGVRAAPTITMGSCCIFRLPVDESAVAILELRLLRRRARCARLARAPRAPNELATAVRADAVQRVRTCGAEGALVAANVGCVVVGGERPCAALAAFPHFQGHDRVPLLGFVEQLSPNQHAPDLRSTRPNLV